MDPSSKGDVLSKLIAFLQTSWFIIQAIARRQQGLALTELELVTLALAGLNAATFVIWSLVAQATWTAKTEAQPSQVEEEDRLVLSFGYVVSNARRDSRAPAAFGLDLLGDSYEGGPIAVFLILFVAIAILFTISISFSFFVLFPLGIDLLLRIIESEPVPQETSRSRGLLAGRIVASLQEFRYRLTSAVTKFVGKWLQEVFRDSEGNGFADLISSLFGCVHCCFWDRHHEHHPSWCFSRLRSHHEVGDRWSRMVIFALFGVIFGGLHCVGWYFQYPTHSEQTLWRATSLVIAVIVAPIDFLLATRLRIVTSIPVKSWNEQHF